MEIGLIIAKYLNQHPKIEKVNHPLLFNESSIDLMKKQATGCTGMLSFYVRSNNFDKLCEFAKNVKLFKFGTSLGGVDSLLDHYGGTMRIFYSKEEQI